jgi:hypothetical protein
MMPGMGQAIQKIAVVREENQALAVRIQPPDRAQHRLALQFNQVCDHARGMNIRTGADHAARLVEGNIVTLARLKHRPPIEKDFVLRRVHLGSQFRHDPSVHTDSPIKDPLFACAPRADAGGGERFLQPFHKSFPPPKAG